MNTTILDALMGNAKPASVTFDELPEGTPFYWENENNSARNGVCVKVKTITGAIKFDGFTRPTEFAWMPLANDNVGTIYHPPGGQRVIPASHYVKSFDVPRGRCGK